MPWEAFCGKGPPRRPTLRHPPPPVNIFDAKIAVQRGADRTYTCVIPISADRRSNGIELMFDIVRGMTAVNVAKQAIMPLPGVARAEPGRGRCAGAGPWQRAR